MGRWIAEHRKTLTIAGLGILQLAAYVVADPRDLPAWVVSAAVAVNTLGVYAIKNAPAARAQPPTRLARPEDRRQAGWP